MPTSEAGQLYVLEGPDGVGKTAIAAALYDRLTAKGHDVLICSFPGRQKGALGELIGRLHHNKSSLGVHSLDPASLQTLHIAAHVDAIHRLLKPAVDAGRTVLLVRYWWSTWVYGIRAGVPARFLRHIIAAEKSVWGTVAPTAIFVVSRRAACPHSTALQQEYEKLRQSEIARCTNVVSISNDASLDAAVSQVERCMGPQSPLQPKASHVSGGRAVPATGGSISILPRRPLRLSPVFDTYWRFAAERQAVFFRYLRGESPPWTEDCVLRQHRFTNAYRASDRVSQFLIREVIYRGDRDPDETVFRILLFKLFNKIDTWRLLTQAFGEVRWETFDLRRYERVLTEAAASGARLYSAAYIMPSGMTSFGYPRKHQNHLRLIDRIMEDEVPARVADAKSLEAVYQLFLTYPMMGPFLAYQMTIDVNYSELTGFSEMDFVVPGPGARDGIAKCFEDTGGRSEAELIRMMAEEQSHHFERLGLSFQDLWGRPLQLVDCQNLFCEVDKYARVMHPNVAGRSGRKRIKQRFAPLGEPITSWYPPKWNLDSAIRRWRELLVQR